MAGAISTASPGRRAIFIRAMGLVLPWFLVPAALAVIWAVAGVPVGSSCGGYCAIAAVAAYFALAIGAAVALLLSAVIAGVLSSAGLPRRARHPWLAVGLISSVPAVLLAAYASWGIWRSVR
jgi:hypothetical protein